MKKIKLFIVMLAFLAFIPVAKADSKEDMQGILDEIFTGDTLTINGVNPTYSDSQFFYTAFVMDEQEFTKKLNAKQECSNGDNCKYDLKVSPNMEYTSVTFTLTDNETQEKVSKTLKLVWKEYEEEKDDVISEVNETFYNEKTRLTDLEFVKYFSEGADKYIPKYLKNSASNSHLNYTLTGQNLLCPSKRYSDYGKGYKNNTFEDSLDGQCGDYLISYDNVYYDLLPTLNLTQYRVVYIPSDTEENLDSYINAAQEKINASYSNIKLSKFTPAPSVTTSLAKYKQSELSYGYDNNLIDKELNTSFEPPYVQMSNGSDKTLLLIAKEEIQPIAEIPSDGENNVNNEGVGNVMPEEEQIVNSSQSEPENPNTGIFLNMTVITSGLFLVGITFNYLKNHRKFYKI